MSIEVSLGSSKLFCMEVALEMGSGSLVKRWICRLEQGLHYENFFVEYNQAWSYKRK